MMAVRQRGDIQPFVVGNDGGHFCEQCPVVVLEHSIFEESAVFGMGFARDIQFVVLGLVDLDAVPEERRHLAFDDQKNPVPLVEFASMGREQTRAKR
ncbi:MAG: hypothetical protein HZC42_04490 [Candidatus Eisenbacteria bacterium]|nr:hypothetical protein [Candidatus Eisenbacteria bacterium]